MVVNAGDTDVIVAQRNDGKVQIAIDVSRGARDVTKAHDDLLCGKLLGPAARERDDGREPQAFSNDWCWRLLVTTAVAVRWRRS